MRDWLYVEGHCKTLDLGKIYMSYTGYGMADVQINNNAYRVS